MPITSTGIGSGLDVEGLVAQLVLAEPAKEVRLARQETTYQTEISSYGFIKSALSDFQSAVKTVADASTYQSKSVSVSDYTKLNATASQAANATYDLMVSALAAKQALATQSSFSSVPLPLGRVRSPLVPERQFTIRELTPIRHLRQSQVQATSRSLLIPRTIHLLV